MIRRVRRRFICFTMCILTGAVLLPMIALNVVPTFMSYNQNKTTLEQAVQNEIRLRTPKPDKQPSKQPDKQNPNEEIPPETTTASGTATVTVTLTSFMTQRTSGQITVTPTEWETKSPAQQTDAMQGVLTQTTAPATEPNRSQQQTQTVLQTRPLPEATQMPEQPENKPVDPWSDDAEKENGADDYGEGNPLWQEHHHKQDANGLERAATLSATVLTSSSTQSQKPEDPPKEDLSNEYFLVVLDSDGNLTETLQADRFDYSEDQINNLIAKVKAKKTQDGRFGGLQYYLENFDEGTVIAFLDCSTDQTFLHQLILISVVVFILMEGAVLWLAMMLTKRAMQPIQISFEKQKQFISDAGHELKTPLTIISANADILQDEIGENKWLKYIRMQVERMRFLIDEMMALTKMEHDTTVSVSEQFSLSSAVENMALPFESQAFEQQKNFQLDIQPEIYFQGNPEQIRRMVGILIDNAFKYSADQGEVRVSLREEAGHAVLEVYNTGKGIREEEKEKIFERFYRSDSSRARATGGYGLGLAIAKSVADVHKIKIEVTSEPEHWVTFTLLFPPIKR